MVGCFPEFVFQFSVAQVLVCLRKQLINNFVFPLGPVLKVSIIIIIIIIIIITIIPATADHNPECKSIDLLITCTAVRSLFCTLFLTICFYNSLTLRNQ